eukprot:CAMPEP_0168452482 /NCGR_PEP_ID=MMETSP0228-20121227/49182_1 /TAXON_ID=133427 /ORGANISM="Protoceratium reticulatum, Strain CCCM 535 (=CCMP 1889)" /LENGTH=300 /DNA_ID=CAMNT_0008467147 /DNA_START=79 /DNA_END=978 /DNA_ORIENTATION=+
MPGELCRRTRCRRAALGVLLAAVVVRGRRGSAADDRAALGPDSLRTPGDDWLLPDQPTPLYFADPRPTSQSDNVGLLAFYYPDADTKWDVGDSGTISLAAPRDPNAVHHFRNAEAAFQALKFWEHAADFEHVDGSRAFKLKGDRHGQEDWSYAGFGSNWKAMSAVLQAKFAPGSVLAHQLIGTGNAFLLEHNPVVGRDRRWSDNNDGSGRNWLGLQLMLLRDDIVGEVEGCWTDDIKKWIDTETGNWVNDEGANAWQLVIRKATSVVLTALDSGPKYPRPEPTRLIPHEPATEKPLEPTT